MCSCRSYIDPPGGRCLTGTGWIHCSKAQIESDHRPRGLLTQSVACQRVSCEGVFVSYPQRFEGLCIRQELEQRGGGEQQEGPVNGLSSLQTRQRELVEAVTSLVSHRRLRTTYRQHVRSTAPVHQMKRSDLKVCI